MAKRRREEADSDDGAAAIVPAPAPAPLYNTVFIDTDLDTHLAMMVSNDDTVSDLKKKIMFEHLQCFPKMGEIKVHSVKVKRKERFYHLPDSMLVRTAFEGIRRNWFLYVSGSVSVDQISNKTCDMHDGNKQVGILCINNYDRDVSDHVTPDDPSKALVPRDSTVAVSSELGMDIRHLKGERCGDSSSDTGKKSAQEKKVATLSHELKDDKSRDSSKGEPVEGPLAKRRKLKHGEDAPHKPAVEGGNGNENTSANNGGFPVHMKVKGKPDTGREHTCAETGVEVSSVSNNKAKNKDETFLEAAESGPSMEHKQEKFVVDSNSSKEPLENGNFRSDSERRDSKRKSRKSKNASPASDVWEATSMHSQNNERERSLEPNLGVANSKDCPPPVIEERHAIDISVYHPTQESTVSNCPRMNIDLANTTEEQDLLPNNCVETVYSPKPNPSNQGEKFTSLKHLVTSSDLSDSKGVAEPDNKRKKKKKKMKSNTRIQQESGIKQNNEPNNTSISLLNFTTDHATDEIRKDERSMPKNASDRTDNASTVPMIEADLTNEVGNESKVSVTCDLEMNGHEICPPSNHVQPDVSAKGGKECGNRPKKKKSKDFSTRVQSDPDIANADQATILKFATNDYRNDGTSKNEITVPQIEADQHNMIGKEGKLSVTCDSNMKMPEMCQFSHHGNDENAILSSKLDAIQRTEGGNSDRTKRKSKSAKKTGGKIQYKLEKADANGMVNGISSTPVNVESREPVTDDTARTEGLMPRTQTAQTTTTLEKWESSAKDVDMQTASCVSPVHGKVDMTFEQLETVSRAQPSNANATEKHENTGGSRKKRKSKKSIATNHDSSSVDPANVASGVSSGLPAADLLIDGSKDQSLLYCMEVENASREGPIDTSVAGSRVEIDEANGSEAGHLPVKRGLNEVGHLQVIQTGTSHLDEENTEKKAKRKKKRNSSTAGKSHSSLAKNDSEVGDKELVASNEKMSVVHQQPNVAEVSRTAKDDNFAEVAVTDVELCETAINSGQANGNPEDKSEVQLQPEVSTDNDEAINFRHYFVPCSQGQDASADKVKKAVKLKGETKAVKKSAKDTVPSTSGGLVNSLAQDENVNAEYKHKSITELGKSKYAKQDKVKRQSNQNSLQVAETEIKAVTNSNDNGCNTHQEVGNPVVHGSENQKGDFACVSKNRKSLDESSSTSTPISSQKFLQRKKDRSLSGSIQRSVASEQVTDKIAKVITTPSTTLRNDRSNNFCEENGAGISDASTRTPSDSSSSSSSGFSVDGSELSHRSTRKGANGAILKNSRGEFYLKSNSSRAKSLTMDEILRSSRRFKKAKLTASQPEVETESQPTDFVPESQPN